MSFNSQDWAALVAGAVRGASEGYATANGDAGANAGRAGTAGVVQYDNQSAKSYAGDKQSVGGVPMSWIVIGVAAVVGLVVLKKVL